MFSPGQALPLLSGEAPGEGVLLFVGGVGGGAPDVDGGGVRCGSHVSVMPLCRRILRRDLRLLGFSILALWVRPLERDIKDRTGLWPHVPVPLRVGVVCCCAPWVSDMEFEPASFEA